MSYYAIRYPSAPDQIRIEKAGSPQAAHRLAFGPFTKATRWQWKNLGTRARIIQSDKKRIGLLKDPVGWISEGPTTDSDTEESV